MREKPHDYFLGAPAAAVCRCKPSYGNRVLVDRVSPRERRTRTNRGVCPECLRPMTITRLDAGHARAVCPRCGGEGFVVVPGSKAWSEMLIREQLEG